MERTEVSTPVRKNKCNVLWTEDRNGDRRWRCRDQLNSYAFKEHKTSCWYQSCPGRVEERLHKIEDPAQICANYNCSNKVASNRKKYCSDKCRKQKARADYEMRNPQRKRRH